MTPQELLLVVYCLIDDGLKALKLGRLRPRGPAPKLSDAEVITIEVVGEAWGLDTTAVNIFGERFGLFFRIFSRVESTEESVLQSSDSEILRFFPVFQDVHRSGLDTDRDLLRQFRRYHLAEFPVLATIHRTTFARQAANLWRVKQLIQQRLAQGLAGDDPLWLVDSLPIDACQFARATFCRRFAGEADYGYDHLRKNTFYGFRLHLRISRHGAIMASRLASARVSDAAMVEALDPPPGSTGVGDRHYWDPALRQQLAASGVTLKAPYYHKSKDPDRRGSAKLASVRYLIETVNGQLAGRFQIKRTWARDLWHLVHRVTRKILGHTILICLAVGATISPLSFDQLMAE